MDSPPDSPCTTPPGPPIRTTLAAPPPPKGGPPSPRVPSYGSVGGDDNNIHNNKLSLGRTSGRDISNSSTRNRRRSLANIALMDAQVHAAPPSSHTASLTSTPPRRTLSITVNHDGDQAADTLLPLLSPIAQSHSIQSAPDRAYHPGQAKSLSGIALRAFGLGLALSVGLIATVYILFCTNSPLWRLPFFLSALSIFHFLEFFTTARYNTSEAEVSSFLLTSNGAAYVVAHSAAAAECLLTNLIWKLSISPTSTSGLLRLTGLIAGMLLVLMGQTVRTAAMAQAGTSFNHIVQQQKRQQHVLVTTGIYAGLRHPSYFGFFWWGLGTQLVMGNVVCLLGYAVVLWRFFSSRIFHEEALLVKFFGKEYLEYRKQVGTKIPFIR